MSDQWETVYMVKAIGNLDILACGAFLYCLIRWHKRILWYPGYIVYVGRSPDYNCTLVYMPTEVLSTTFMK